MRLQEIVIASRGISLSSDLIEELCERGIRIAFLNSSGTPMALVTSPMLTATVERRVIAAFILAPHARMIGARTSAAGSSLASCTIEEKLLRYFAARAGMEKERPHSKTAPSPCAGYDAPRWQLRASLPTKCAQPSLMGLEGTRRARLLEADREHAPGRSRLCRPVLTKELPMPGGGGGVTPP